MPRECFSLSIPLKQLSKTFSALSIPSLLKCPVSKGNCAQARLPLLMVNFKGVSVVISLSIFFTPIAIFSMLPASTGTISYLGLSVNWLPPLDKGGVLLNWEVVPVANKSVKASNMSGSFASSPCSVVQ